MILINSQPLDVNAEKDETHPLHSQALEFKAGVKNLREMFKSQIKFVRPGYPKKNRGTDSKGREIENMTEPTPPTRIPLQARAVGRNGIQEIWDYCDGRARLLPNNLWEATGKRSIMPTDSFIIDLESKPDLAFFLYYKSPLVLSGQWIVYDPDGDAKAKGDKKRLELDLNHALYGVLSDDNIEQLKVVAQAYGISRTDKKHPDNIRVELEKAVLDGEVKKRSDPTARGVKEFIEELKVTDSVKLRSLVMVGIDDDKIKWSGDGRYKVGERELCKVPATELTRKQDYLCNHLLMMANRPKLQDLLKDLVTKEYLDKADSKAIFWLARMMGEKVEFKPKEEIKEIVYKIFIGE